MPLYKVVEKICNLPPIICFQIYKNPGGMIYRFNTKDFFSDMV